MKDDVFRNVLIPLLLIALLANQNSYAQESSSADSSDAQTQTEKTDTKQPAERSAEQQPARQPQDKGRGGDIFRPSEEISEDFAVSFPVDI